MGACFHFLLLPFFFLSFFFPLLPYARPPPSHRRVVSHSELPAKKRKPDASSDARATTPSPSTEKRDDASDAEVATPPKEPVRGAVARSEGGYL